MTISRDTHSNSNYQHSRVFASMKGVKETIKSNLTTSQYLQILDEYLDRAAIPIICSSNYFDAGLSRLLGWQEKHFRRKISFLERPLVSALILTFLLQNTSDAKVEAYREIRLDRGIRIHLMRAFLSAMSDYEAACNCELVNPYTRQVDLSYCLYVKQTTERMLEAPGSLLAAIHETRFWLDRALTFKQQIMEKFIRLTLMTAQKDYVKYFEFRAKLDDIIQTYLLAASRAVDKCDARQGALTSHVQNWFLTARSRVLESLAEKEVEHLDLNSEEFKALLSQDATAEDRVVNAEQATLIARLARLVDPTGAARLFLGIEECLTDEERVRVGARRASMTDSFIHN